MKLESVVEKDFLCIDEDATLGKLVENISKSSRNIFPVLNTEKELVGIVLLDELIENRALK